MNFRLVLVGGGLQNALIALALLRKDPGASLVLLERDARLGGNHTWSFHLSDLEPDVVPLLEPLLVRRWPGHTVAFPGFTRSLGTPYASTDSSRLHQVVSDAFGSATHAELRRETPVRSVGRNEIMTAAGERLEAIRVVDSRGPAAGPGRAGYQKFLGQEVRLTTPWSDALPCLMDARLPQTGGFHFMYTLPLAPDRVLVEDTVYSTSPLLDPASMRASVRRYLARRGADAPEVIREELGVLPLPYEPFVPCHGEPLLAGYAGGWFHPTTGYSLPFAARVARLFADAWPNFPSAASLAHLAHALGHQIRFATRLNRLLFEATPGSERWRVLDRFYRLPQGTIERFYALRTTLGDRMRILFGRPPRGLSWRRAAQAWGAA